MKDLITTLASIFIFSIFLLQFSSNLSVQHRLICTDRAIDNFRGIVKEEGYVSHENRALLVSSIKEIHRCDSAEITVTGDTTKRDRGELIRYYIKYPVKNLIAAYKALGISESENRVYMEEENWVVSRYQKETEKKEDSEVE